MQQTSTSGTKPSFALDRSRFQRVLRNLPRLLALEDHAEANGFKDARAATHVLSRLIIAMNGVATKLSRVSVGDESAAGRAAAEAADILWAFGEGCAAHSPNLEMRDDDRPT